MMRYFLYSVILVLSFSGCKEDPVDPIDPTGPMLKLKYKFDANQERLNNIGLPATLPAGHAAQTPEFKGLSTHFIEIVPNMWTPYKSGEELYQGAEVNTNTSNFHNFDTAIDFDQAIVSDEDEIFHEIPLKAIIPNTYQHVRASVAYQNYDIKYNILNIPFVGNLLNQNGTVASFLGYFMHLNNVQPRNQELAINADKLQGFWAFETDLTAPYQTYNQLLSGEPDPALNATTVVNPFPTSIPPGTCVVSGSFDAPLVITGNETEDITVTLSFSINNSLEWIDTNGNGELDLDFDGNSLEPIVDMGLRGLKAIKN